MSEKQEGAVLLGGVRFVKASTYKEQAYELIKDAILYRRLKVGEVYSQDALCRELEISRTPVREALLELQKEGYISFLRGRGVMVIPVTPEEARDIAEMRRYMEILGSRLAAKLSTEPQRERMREVLRAMRKGAAEKDPKYLYRLDREFHRALFEASQNSLLVKTVENLREQFLRFETQTAFNTMEGILEVCDEHQGILDGIEARNPDRAEEAMVLHLDRTYGRTVQKRNHDEKGASQ